MLQIRLFRDEGVLHFLELLNVQRAVGKAVFDSVDLGFDDRKRGFEPVNLFLLHVGSLPFPRFNAGKELVLPFIRNGDQLRVSFHFLRKLLLANIAAVIAAVRFAFVRAAVVGITLHALFNAPFAGDAVSARTADGKLEKRKSFIVPALARLPVNEWLVERQVRRA